jgi:SET domain-containing protein
MDNVYVGNSEIKDNGVFAARDFKSGDVVIKWHPKVIDEKELKKLSKDERRYISSAGGGKYYVMQPPEKFVDHSCDPNTKTQNDSDVAIRNIEKDEEITSDYCEGNLVEFKCNCGKPNCRGVID